MALEFQFGFLGPGNNYVATLTKTGAAGFPHGEPIVKFSGLPSDFCDEYRRFLGLPAYIYNIRGHDFLSFVAQWQGIGKDVSGPLDQSLTMYKEIKVLERFAEKERSKNTEERKAKREANLIASFGPSPDTFFADSLVLERYGWKNLPSDLEEEVQEVVCQKGWVLEWSRWTDKTKIHDVAINSNNGWVMQLNEGRDWRIGEPLHDTLRKALTEGKKRGFSIAKLFLNHQHPEEYVLLFENGTVHARLHGAFERDLKELLRIWFNAKSKNNKNVDDSEWFNFTSSRNIPQKEVDKRMAVYYAQRGVFCHERGNILRAQHLERVRAQPRDNLVLTEDCVRYFLFAYKYLKEANRHDQSNLDIQAIYLDALKAVRNAHYDEEFEEEISSAELLTRRDKSLSKSNVQKEENKDMKNFQRDYLRAIRVLKDIGDEELARELVEGHTLQLPPVFVPDSGWTGWSHTNAKELKTSTRPEANNTGPETERPRPGLQNDETQSEPTNPGGTMSFLEMGTARSVRSLPPEPPRRSRGV